MRTNTLGLYIPPRGAELVTIQKQCSVELSALLSFGATSLSCETPPSKVAKDEQRDQQPPVVALILHVFVS